MNIKCKQTYILIPHSHRQNMFGETGLADQESETEIRKTEFFIGCNTCSC